MLWYEYYSHVDYIALCTSAKQKGVVVMGYSTKEVVKILQGDGWYKVGQKGSHMFFKHPVKKNRIPVQANKKDLPKGTYYGILKSAGLK
jgi:predicted RNA binding protein YcfA (HicA-like mRNA interferase family)